MRMLPVVIVTLLTTFFSTAKAKDYPITAHEGTDYNMDAIAVETEINKELNEPVRIEFHRDQAFRGASVGKPWRVLSVAWQLESGGGAHCVVAVISGSKIARVDALAGERDSLPWSCDGEPALRITDIDGDNCPEVLALYQMRPPSGEVFQWPVVLRCNLNESKWEMDSEKTQYLRSTLNTSPIVSLRQMEKLLRTSP
jgi:hypothetical protein